MRITEHMYCGFTDKKHTVSENMLLKKFLKFPMYSIYMSCLTRFQMASFNRKLSLYNWWYFELFVL